MCWEVTDLDILSHSNCKYPRGKASSESLSVALLSPTSVKSFKSAAIRPNDISYGGLLAFETVSTTIERLNPLPSLGSLGGIYYPEQYFGLTYD